VPKLLSAVARSIVMGRSVAHGSPRTTSATRTNARRPSGGGPAPSPTESASAAPAVSCVPELLESRTHLSVAQDADGWTVVTPERDSRVIYVSSSAGDDDHSGRSPDRPVKSVAAGAALIRNNSSDQLLLKRGDVWDEAIGAWWKRGKSEQEPILIGAYGAGDRPRLNTGGRGAFNAGKSRHESIDHVSIIGLHLSAHTRLKGEDFVRSEGEAGIRLLAPTDDFLIEDCRIEGYKDNIIFADFFGPLTDITVRRSVIVDAYSIDHAHAQGLYATGVQGLTIEENVFDHNGWMEGVAGAGQTGFNHNVYLRADNKGVVVRGNVFANASSHGLQARSGGRVEDNLFLDNPIGMSFGLVNGSPATPGGVTGVVNGNVFLGARSIGSNGVRGWGMEVGNTRPGGGTVVSNNIFASAGEDGRNPAIVIGAGSNVLNADDAAGVNDLTIRGNVIYDWSDGIRIASSLKPGSTGLTAFGGLAVRDNDFQNLDGKAILHDMQFAAAAESWSGNRYDPRPKFTTQYNTVTWDRWKRDREPTAKASKVRYVEPGRTAASYNASLGGDRSTAAFVAAARAQSRETWRREHTATAAIEYVHGGFAEAGQAAPAAPGGATPPPAPQQPPAVPAAPPLATGPGGGDVVTSPVLPEPQPVPRDWSAPATPTAAAHLPGVIRLPAADAALAFQVTYADDAGIDATTLDGGDLRLAGRGGFDQSASLVSVQQTGAETVATYAVMPPEGGWGRAHRGRYALVTNAEQVRDADGHTVEPAELAEFKLAVARQRAPQRPPRAERPAKPARADRAPTVRKVKLATRGGDGGARVTAWFSKDVAASVGAEDLFLFAADGTRIDLSPLAVTYDTAKHAATWTLPGLPEGQRPSGRYRVVFPAWGITDAAGQMLDGDRDGEGGDDFAPAKTLKVR
jgi:hypothetical protein